MNGSRASEERAAVVADGLDDGAARVAGLVGGAAVWAGVEAARGRLLGGARPEVLVLLLGRAHDGASAGALKSAAPEVPVLVLALEGSGVEQRLAALRAGADDLVSWPLDPRELRLRADALRLRSARAARSRAEMDELRRLASFKDELVSLLVHDLRNPLSGMLGFLSALDADTRGANAEVRDDLEGAIDAARKLEEVVQELLQIRMLEERAMTLLPATVPLREVAASAIASLEGAARERVVALTLSGDPVARGSLDPRLLRRALENLIANALRYSPRGSMVDVSARREDGEAVFIVADRGPGVPDELKQAVFDKYSTLDAPGARSGFGLGLYQVKLAVEAHGGRVRVRDAEGGGAAFEIRLPAP